MRFAPRSSHVYSTIQARWPDPGRNHRIRGIAPHQHGKIFENVAASLSSRCNSRVANFNSRAPCSIRKNHFNPAAAGRVLHGVFKGQSRKDARWQRDRRRFAPTAGSSFRNWIPLAVVRMPAFSLPAISLECSTSRTSDQTRRIVPHRRNIALERERRHSDDRQGNPIS